MKVALRLLTMANRFKCAQNGVHVCFKQGNIFLNLICFVKLAFVYVLEENSVWKGSFRFIQAADTQFGLIDQLKYVDWSVDDISIPLAQSKAYRDRGISVWDEEIRLSKLAIEQWNQMIPKPKFVIICGDLVDDFPGCKHRDAQLADFKKTFELLDTSIPLVLLPGNHDLLNCPTPETVDEYRNMFGDDYFVFWVDGVFFIVINVQYYKDRTLTQEYAEIHDKWLDRQLEEAKSRDYKHIIVFQHIPWFIHDVNEPLDEIVSL